MAEYFVGLDIGTDSVGWAVTDMSYRVQKKNGKALWGVRLFDQAKTAAERRGFRTARRRLERRNQRILWLRQLFSEEIAKVDPAFFQRLDESKFEEEDKRTDANGQPLGKHILFAGNGYTDTDYFRDFPTIYHLRNALIQENRAFDVRLVYLAIQHILKKRGHFLFGNISLDEVSLERCFEGLCQYLNEEYEIEFPIADAEQFRRVLSDRSLSVSRKKAALMAAAGVDKRNEQLCAILALLAGAKVRLANLFQCEFSDAEIDSLSFRDDFDAIEPQLAEMLEDRLQLILYIKAVYDQSMLDELLRGKQYLSEAKIEVYERHREDLRRLKRIFKAAGNDEYREMFRAAREKLDNYPAYTGHAAKNYCCDYEKFRKYASKKIQEIIKSLPDGDIREIEAKEILSSLEAGIFLPKQTNKDNGLIPHQVHEKELKAILDRASAYLPFLNQADESGLSPREQILAVFRFRIPYYVGPLNARSSKAWLVRTDERILPWNFESVVNLEKSAEKFITRMTAKCSYIGEDVLPKDSLLYGRFVVLNELNKLKINGKPITVATKKRIYEELFGRGRKVSQKQLADFLLANGLMQRGDEITGIDGDFKGVLSSRRIFAQILSRGDTEDMVEDIIRHLALFGEDRRLMERWLKKSYGQQLDAEDRAYVLSQRKKISGWGNLSREFLTQIRYTNDQTGEIWSIMDALWETNDNLMELLSGRYGFARAIEDYREAKYGGKDRTLDEILKDSYASPGIRRAIHQTIGIVAEIEKIMGGAPRRIFVEMARQDGIKGERGRKASRKMSLVQLYNQCGEIDPELHMQLESCDDETLRSDKWYLYYTQLGKCMYCGAPLNSIWDRSICDIDHIYPQCRVKDDSLENRVLVHKDCNALKADRYPVSADVQRKMRPLWNMLKKRSLIGEKKYERLTRNKEFEDAELSEFIARQLVETRQSCKIAAELLKNRFGDQTEIVYVKAGNVSAFRQDQRIVNGVQKQAWMCKNVDSRQDPVFLKCREVNDIHHAKDAYLNIVVGNVYHLKFTRNPMNFIREKQAYSLNRMFDRDVVRGNEWAWHAGETGTIATVRHVMRKNNVLFTRYANEEKGELFDQMLMPRCKGQAMIKSSDPRMTTEKFGGYNKRKGAYFCLVESTEKKKRVRSIEAVYRMYKTLYESDPEGYCKTVLSLKDPKVLIRCIKINALFSIDGFQMHISGRSGDGIIYKNANQLIIDPEWNAYVKGLGKYLERCKAARNALPITAFDGITTEQNEALYEIFVEKLNTARYRVKYENVRDKLEKNREKFAKLTAADQSATLLGILNLFTTNAASADLSLLGEGKKVGILKISKNLQALENRRFVLIHQSVTGVFEQEIDLMKVGKTE